MEAEDHQDYIKVLHIINSTEFEIAKERIKSNILIFQNKSILVNPMYNAISQNFILLKAKVKNIRPHIRSKRGLIDVLGTGLKIIAGTMDHEDKRQIKAKLDELLEDER